MLRLFALTIGGICACGALAAADAASLPPAKRTAVEWIEQHREQIVEVNQAIWSHAELGLAELESSATLSEWLARNGFTIDRGVADMPTAFVASYGSGKPVIAIMAEFDALPGLSQAADTQRRAIVAGGAGHGCGHNLHGTAGAAAAIALKEAIAAHRLRGTIRLYGTPAEEQLIGKVYMARAGVMDGIDAVLYWHPADLTAAWYYSTLADASVRFTFTGVSAHASAAPHRGRSALDAVELMNVGVNYLREHVKDDARIHYVITDGGKQPNDVPARAQVWYDIRARTHDDVEIYYRRIVDIANGAALMTGTRVETRVDADTHELLPNEPLARVMDANLRMIGAPQFAPAEVTFARELQESFAQESLAQHTQLEFEHAVPVGIIPLPEEPGRLPVSTDLGDVSWKAPTAALSVASYPAGISIHSWAVVASAGAPIGHRGLLTAAKVLAATGIDLLSKPQLVESAWVDLHTRAQAAKFNSLIPPEQKAPQSAL
jgi:aminobenzoyl-glutamate utilization protein B